MRRIFADFAFRLAHRALDRIDHTTPPALRARLIMRSHFWSDVEVWISGIMTWSDLRASRARRFRQGEPPTLISITGVVL